MIIPEVIKSTPAPVSKEDIVAVVKKIARYEKKIQGEVEIHVVTAGEIQKLNKQFRGINKPTDVLSFGWQEDGTVLPGGMLGQVYLCYGYISQQARRFKVSAREEFVRMLIHGLLHVVGYDHQEAGEAAIMFTQQEKIIKKIVKDFSC